LLVVIVYLLNTNQSKDGQSIGGDHTFFLKGRLSRMESIRSLKKKVYTVHTYDDDNFQEPQTPAPKKRRQTVHAAPFSVFAAAAAVVVASLFLYLRGGRGEARVRSVLELDPVLTTTIHRLVLLGLSVWCACPYRRIRLRVCKYICIAGYLLSILPYLAHPAHGKVVAPDTVFEMEGGGGGGGEEEGK
jgi:hypothetical protein